MKHYGDITKINGAEIDPVWIITGGSPCQDLSIAGKRAGLAGERSGLFMDQIRIIKEMRENDRKTNSGTDKHIRPRFMVWENVPGAFSSNGGEDFRAVLEETARVADKNTVIPRPEGGRWTPSGCIMGDGWSIAWRLHDAQFWGVPQRRKRIALVADFGGESAPEILFECKGMSRDTTKSREEGQETATDAEGSVGETSTIVFEPGAASRVGGHIYEDKAGSLRANAGDNQQAVVYGGGESYVLQGGGAISFQERAGKSGGGKGILIQDERTGALSTLNNQSVFCLQGNGIDRGENSGCNGKDWRENEAYTLNTMDRHAVAYDASRTDDGSVPIENHPADSRVKLSDYPQMKAESQCYREDDISNTLVNGTNPGFQNGVCYDLDRASFNQGQNAKFGFSVEEEKIGAQVAKGPGAVCSSVVRRLTPLECERLQGYPDGWTNIGDWIDSKGKKHKGEADSPRYKALGNSIALPFWEWMAERMLNVLRADMVQELTMASLFDGIGGFPLVFSRHGCAPVWASEVESFCIEVTKKRFPDNE